MIQVHPKSPEGHGRCWEKPKTQYLANNKLIKIVSEKTVIWNGLYRRRRNSCMTMNVVSWLSASKPSKLSSRLALSSRLMLFVREFARWLLKSHRGKLPHSLKMQRNRNKLTCIQKSSLISSSLFLADSFIQSLSSHFSSPLLPWLLEWQSLLFPVFVFWEVFLFFALHKITKIRPQSPLYILNAEAIASSIN